MSDEQNWEDILGAKNVQEFFGEPDSKVTMVDVLDFESILRALEEKINAGGWEQKPSLLVLRGNEIGAELLQFELPPEMVENFPRGFAGFTTELTHYIAKHRDGGPNAEFIQMLQQEYLGPAFQAIVVSTEGWTVPEPDPDNAEQWAEWRKAANEGNFHEHPDRIELRVTALLSTVSDFHVIKRDRNDSIDYLMVPGKDWELGAQGGMTEVMRALIRAFVGLNLLQGLSNKEITDYWQGEYLKATRWVEEQQALRGQHDSEEGDK